MAKCPRCSENSKLTGKDWDCGFFYVKQFWRREKVHGILKDGKVIYTILKLNKKNSHG